ncbi:hypothetical protein KA025_00950 [Candidatus Saccharibacteria bacterium]|nr:hypothetical protein [Candidatus Saccharibacteria bacterium]MBP7834634.1 hypothetical protein [Candidatus Saccharibacteria bacterium]
MKSKELLPQQTFQETSFSNMARFASKSIITTGPAEHYESYKFEESSSEGMTMDESYFKPKGDN